MGEELGRAAEDGESSGNHSQRDEDLGGDEISTKQKAERRQKRAKAGFWQIPISKWQVEAELPLPRRP